MIRWGSFFMTSLDELADLPLIVTLRSVSSEVVVLGSSPRLLAADAASRSSAGMPAWIDVINLAWRAKDS